MTTLDARSSGQSGDAAVPNLLWGTSARSLVVAVDDHAAPADQVAPGGQVVPADQGGPGDLVAPAGSGPGRVDVRGPRFASAVTATVLAVALVVQGPVGVVLVAIQVTVFAIATTFGVAHTPWAPLFRFVRRTVPLAPATAFESATPPRFAQACGLLVAGTGLVALLTGATTLGWSAMGIVVALATVLATSGLCIGCELWLLGQRVVGGRP